jgi:hypothetical protein
MSEKAIGYQNGEVVLFYPIPDPDSKILRSDMMSMNAERSVGFFLFDDFDQLRERSGGCQNTCKQTYCVLHAHAQVKFHSS